MKKQSLLFVAMIATVISTYGCDGDKRDFYNSIVDNNGNVHYCHPQITGSGENAEITFKTLKCRKRLNADKEYEDNAITPLKVGDMEPSGNTLKGCTDSKLECVDTDARPDCVFCKDYITDYKACISFRNNFFFSKEISIPDTSISFVGTTKANYIGNYSNTTVFDFCPKDYPVHNRLSFKRGFVSSKGASLSFDS